MAVTTQIMTDEQRKSVALEYLKAFDHGRVTSTGGSILVRVGMHAEHLEIDLDQMADMMRAERAAESGFGL